MDLLSAMPPMPAAPGNTMGAGEPIPEMGGVVEFGSLFQQCLGKQEGQMQDTLLAVPQGEQNVISGFQLLDPQEQAVVNQLLDGIGMDSETDSMDSEIIEQLQVLLGQLQTLLEQAQQPELLPEEIQELTTEFAQDFREILSQIEKMGSLEFEPAQVKKSIESLQDQIVQSFEQLSPYLPAEATIANESSDGNNSGDFLASTEKSSEALSSENASSAPSVNIQKVMPETATADESKNQTKGSSDEIASEILGSVTRGSQSDLGDSKQGQEEMFKRNFVREESKVSEDLAQSQKEKLDEMESNDVGNKAQSLDEEQTFNIEKVVESHNGADSKPLNGDSSTNDSRPTHVQNQAPISETTKIQESNAPRAHVAERIQQHTAVHQVAHKIQFMVQNGDGKAILRLDPPDLGHVEIEVDSSPGEMRIHMKVDNEAVKLVMEASVANLRESLEQQNVKLEKLEVQVDSARTEAQAKGQDNTGNRRPGGKGGRGMRFAEVVVDQPQSDTGRRLGYNTMELIA